MQPRGAGRFNGLLVVGLLGLLYRRLPGGSVRVPQILMLTDSSVCLALGGKLLPLTDPDPVSPLALSQTTSLRSRGLGASRL